MTNQKNYEKIIFSKENMLYNRYWTRSCSISNLQLTLALLVSKTTSHNTTGQSKTRKFWNIFGAPVDGYLSYLRI